MKFLTSSLLFVLNMAVSFPGSLQISVAAETFLDQRHLSDIADISFPAEQSKNLVPTEVVESPHLPLVTKGRPPLLLKTSNPRTHFTHSDLLAEIYFDWKRDRIKENAAQIVEHTATLLQHDSSRRVDLLAICDKRGSEAYSLTLGRQRTLMLAEYFKSLGIPSRQMTQVSYGTQPLCRNQNLICDMGKQQNHKAFRFLAMASSRAGCLVQVRLQDSQLTRTSQEILSRKPFLQRIHLAETR